MKEIVFFSKWVAGVCLAIGMNSCGIKQLETSEKQKTREAEETKSFEFVESYNCPCPEGLREPRIQLYTNNTQHFKGEYALSETSEIRGRVLREDSIPVPFVLVYIYNTNIADSTDENGYYSLKNIPNGEVVLGVSSPEHFQCSLPSFRIKSPQMFTASTIKLQILRAQLLKPIIYLYPERETDVTVQLDYKGKISHSYPKYVDSWKVHAKTDGTLTDDSGRSYYALFWEGIPTKQYTVKTGFIVKGGETIPFLESKLDQLGLTEREANEFIMFWYPKLEANPYNLIHFSTDEYLESAKLNVEPAPETVIRIMMVYKPLSAPIDIPLQVLPEKPVRNGFTLVEWGGTGLREPQPAVP